MNLITFGLVGAALGGYLVFRLGRTYLQFRSRRLIVCPETLRPAAVDLEAGRALRTSLVGHATLRLRDCSRWPERAGCGQECVAQIEAAPEDCLVRNLVEKFYRGAICALCGHPIGAVNPGVPRPGFLAPSGRTVSWVEIRAEELPEIFATHKPVCSSCDVAESFRREFPDRVVDRVGDRSGMRNRVLH